MIALAIFYLLIIAILLLTIPLIQKCFDTFSSFQVHEKNKELLLKNQLKQQNQIQKNKESVNEINKLIQNRLIEFESKFKLNKSFNNRLEMLLENTKKVIIASLKQVK